MDPANYQTETFDTSSGNFGAFIEQIKRMEDATIQTNDIQGRADMTVQSGEMTLEIAPDNRTKRVVYKNTNRVGFDVTAEGTTLGSENVDLRVTDSSGQKLDNVSSRVDRETLTLDDSQESFTLVWEPKWGDLSSDTDYQIIAEGESDQAFATVEVLAQDTAYLELDIVNTSAPIEYGDTLSTEVRVTNIGESDIVDNNSKVTLSITEPDGTETDIEEGKPFSLDAGDTTTLTLDYDTLKLDDSNTGEVEVKAKAGGEVDTETVTMTQPTIVADPSIESLPANQTGLTQKIRFTLGEDLAGSGKVSIDLSDTREAVNYDGSSSWSIEEGDKDNGQIIVNTNSNRVTSVSYKTGGSESAGDEIVLRADGVDTTDADSDIRYDVEYELTSSNDYQNGDYSNTTSFRTTG